MAYSYGEIAFRLSDEAAIVTFRKKDNSIRTMLCTRCVSLLRYFTKDENHMVACLNGHDKRCTASNNTLAVIDLVIEEARSFNLDRIEHIQWLGYPQTQEQFDYCMNIFTSLKDAWGSYDSLSDIAKYQFRQSLGLEA